MRQASTPPEPPPNKNAPTRILRVEPTTNALNPKPRARSGRTPVCRSPGFLSWPGLLLERTDRARNQNVRIFLGSPKANIGEPKKPPNNHKETPGELFGHAAIAVSNNRVNEV